ncbi:hypothetical protein C7T94_09305 [Pedobacter yulinensis]|uniref:DUF2116 family Zn-ribbon domain-containing protein n=1 Tax=Pedobacter yulinensis TaxID=2126353 RepID=A0A2T3HK60_9SPHI|nr:hypothetical protein [Pedobacter yulinensis]PST82827.1 hypothetical protein C7T94_09305 [Pedobacter yulinensis]
MNQIPEKNCPHCGAPLAQRTHSPFCSAQCRAAGPENAGNSPALATALSAVHQNYLLLKRFFETPARELFRQIVPEHELLDKGFRPEFFTSICIDARGTVTHYCFEFGWSKNKPGQLELSVETDRPGAVRDVISYPF